MMKNKLPQMPHFIRAYNHANILRTNKKNTLLKKKKKTTNTFDLFGNTWENEF